MTLHVACSGWLLGEPSGANRRLLAVLAHAGTLLADGERITVLHRADFEPPPLPRIAWQPIAIPAGPAWRRIRAEQRLLPACLQGLGANVYEHGFLPLPRLPVPSCLTLHDLRAADGLTRWPRWFARAVLRRSCARAAAVAVPSRFTADRLRRFVPSASPSVIHNGVDAPSSAPPAAGWPVPPNGFVLHVGHVEARKNLEVVARALALVPASQRPELWLAGRDAGGLPALLALAVRLSCHTSIRVLGTVSDDALPGLYAEARAVVMPSTYEGFGLPALEGLAHGRPVLASRAAALPEVLGQAGLLLAPHDPSAWADAIVATAHDGASAAEVRRARAAQFPWPRAVELQISVWRGVLARQR
ncbi:MAG TPA: glycosyltransferase family 1 protein [Planctomycetota bacterium]|nr:glycosyltransferase family 1 protein [Planctomycetota bacterium]